MKRKRKLSEFPWQYVFFTTFSGNADLDRHLSSLLRSADVLHLVKFDSDLVLSNDESTSDLADRVSLKVRELDLAQSRVSHTLIRIDAIVERTACIDGVKKDFESAATFVQTFLQIDSKYKDFASDQREQLLASKKQLESIVRKRLSAAVDQRDHATILRFVRLYPPLGLEEEGLQAYVGYLKKVVSMRLRLEFDQLVELMEQSYSSSSVGNQDFQSNVILNELRSPTITEFPKNWGCPFLERPEPSFLEVTAMQDVSLEQYSLQASWLNEISKS
ncbi:hypothetical protein RJ640_002741 [Escallonia rubra]|uniref:Conserved oligomeric Golgi complex subunit 4 n=1 Tax=Escallonia rubra TaxID=112253 RepID=A0AA88US42_9ASTE|nr:hypothetical protein RJ640_002741 [Escallonia rubra]